MKWLAFLLVLVCGGAQAQNPPIVGPLQTQNSLSEIKVNGPAAQAAALSNIGGGVGGGFARVCDVFTNGCGASFSVVERMLGTYNGPIFQLYRADGQTRQFGTIAVTGFVNTALVHAFCDGYECGFQYIYNQDSTTGDAYFQPLFANMPLLGWAANGWPVAVLQPGLWLAAAGLPTNGRWMRDQAITNLPGPQSQAMFLATDNGTPPQVDTVSSSSANPPGGPTTGDKQGDAMAIELVNSHPYVQIPPSGQMFGEDLEVGTPTHLFGAYPAGFAQIAGMIEYFQPSGQVLAQVLTSACVPLPGILCQASVTYSGSSFVPINPQIFGQALLRAGTGTDNTPYGGRFQSLAIIYYATSNSENTAALNAIAGTHFPRQPSPCGVNGLLSSTGPLTATNPSAFPGTPQSFIGRPAVNETNFVAGWGMALFNPAWNNQIFRALRADNGQGYEEYPLGCDANLGQLTVDISGTTATAPVWWDQSGHNLQFQTHDLLTQPAISPTGINGKPCLNFTFPTVVHITGTLTGGSPAGNPGVLTVTATDGTILVGMVDAQAGTRGVILSQIDGTPGGNGDYSVANPSSVTFSNTSSVLTGAPYMLTQTGVFGVPGLGGLSQNMTVEVVFQTPNTLGPPAGPIISLPAGWWFGEKDNAFQLAFAHNGGGVDLLGPTFTPNVPHFAYVTIDNGTPYGTTPQNIAISIDGGAPVTGTTSFGFLGAGDYFALGVGSTGDAALGHFQGCIAMVKIYNDVEAPANLLADYEMAHAEYATP